MKTIFSLNSANWFFRDCSNQEWLPATVPGCVHADLVACDKIPDPYYGSNELDLQWIEERDWEYQTEFEVSGALLESDVIELLADGLDTVATVWLNDVKIGASDNMYIAHCWKVQKYLKVGVNTLRIRFESAMDYIRNHRTSFTPPVDHLDPVGNSVRIRKEPCQFGWDWGPRLVTAGVWRDIRLEAWSVATLDRFTVDQIHSDKGSVSLSVAAQLSGRKFGVRYVVEVSFEGDVVASAEADAETMAELSIPKPQLWWPAGQGAQPLYTVTVTAFTKDGSELGQKSKRIGLRTVKLDRSKDEWGESFQFVVNGRPVFAKGANWIPADCFVAGLKREDYARDLIAAVQANMNCVRVWGGGIYESEDFYDLCDELGLMVWQDFMFSCILVPADKSFLKSVKVEAVQQVARLRDRACLALWCGNNELPQLNQKFFAAKPKLKRDYVKLFHELLPSIVEAGSAGTDYWPSSEWRGVFESGHELGEKSGDTHYWDVWHSRHPVKDYEKWNFRFCSEFGMQSYSSPQTNATFAPQDSNVFGPIMENHQKNTAGNQVILYYVSQRYRFPKSQDDLIWLSQLNQAYCMQIGVEHYRRLMPRCMGAIYWQLNDCWPVASWSSIEYTGRWKALHYAARRFNAPALVSAHVRGDEIVGKGNYRETSIREVDLYTVYDAPKSAKGTLIWDLYHMDGRQLQTSKKSVRLRHGQSVLHKTVDLSQAMAEHGRENIYLKIALLIGGDIVSEQSVLLAPPRFIDFPEAKTQAEVKIESAKEAVITFTSTAYQHAFTFDFDDSNYKVLDNGFDLYPNEPKQVRVELKQRVSKKNLLNALSYKSLKDSY
ncbi:glycoside hydrolase family 2 protein [Coraliomargarita algicola]|uniref:Beta-mannosidase B n=1 Tax=Coraliomargarita algicola TaxID=3092156 RepID=A0ABZ0RKN8_9BACT|nr:glycoside hydrolase family 2 protein [Coraliomargarita sp. J2-16]WPJ95829.1 glycoside hydrolase family 2 protein [Coraliomargarita sp. J2-16]